MPTQIGQRIRTRRRELQIKQSDLAGSVGISPSYLNLIEHNRRRVTDRVVSAIAFALEVDVEELTDSAEAALTSDLRDISVQHAALRPESDRVEELVGRFPGWSRVMAAQARQMREQTAAVAALTDRMNYDPHLQSTLHEMLTNITAIRSTAGILKTESDIPEAQRTRFQNSIHDESIRLSDAANQLVTYLDQAEESPKDASMPIEAFEQFLERHDHVFDRLESEDAIEEIIQEEASLVGAETQERARQRLSLYREDVVAMPLDAFADAAASCGYSAAHLARQFDVSVFAAFRRLATLARENIPAPRFGLVIINAAGNPMFRRPLPGFSLPRFASICALWPVYQALSAPSRPLQHILVMPDGSEFLAHSIAQPISETSFGELPQIAAGMLVTALNDGFSWGMIDRPTRSMRLSVGTSCRLCQRSGCVARAEPSLLPEAV